MTEHTAPGAGDETTRSEVPLSEASLSGYKFDAKTEARIEEEVRRRTLALLASAGLPEEGVAKEVLYWLPQEFVEWYRDLYLRAFTLNGARGRQSAVRVNSRGETVDVGDNPKAGPGKLKRRKGESAEAFQDRVRSLVGVGHGGGGKKWKEYYTITDDAAFKTKQLVDRRLMELVQGRGIRKGRNRRK